MIEEGEKQTDNQKRQEAICLYLYESDKNIFSWFISKYRTISFSFYFLIRHDIKYF